MSANLKKVKVVQDDSFHWYVIPSDRVQEFFKDEQDENMVDSGEFGNKWGGFMTGGDLNNIQLYAEI